MGSPCLHISILVFDVLSRLISNAYDNEQVKGIKLAPYASTLTHLFFADDVILFTGDSAEEIYNIVSILNVFTSASGQKINTTKSGIICGHRVNTLLKSRLTDMTSIPIWDNPRKYL